MLYVVLLGELHCIVCHHVMSVMESCIDIYMVPQSQCVLHHSMHASAAYICSTHFRYYATTMLLLETCDNVSDCDCDCDCDYCYY
jgi:hypothetical protein